MGQHECEVNRVCRMIARSNSVATLLFVFAAACAGEQAAGPDREPIAEPSLRSTLQVASQRVTALDSQWRPADADITSRPGEASVETGSLSVSAKIEQVTTGLESTISRIVVTTDQSAPKVIIQNAVNLGAIAWSPDGSRLAYCEGTLVHVVDRDGGNRQILYAGPGGPYPGACLELAWSSDGSQLSFIQLEHASELSLANPSRVVLTLEVKETEE